MDASELLTRFCSKHILDSHIPQAVESLSARLQQQMVAVSFVGLPDEYQPLRKGLSAVTSTTLVGVRMSMRMPIESMLSWPIPEPFFLTEGNSTLTPRPSVPIVYYQIVGSAEAHREAASLARDSGAPPLQQQQSASTLDMLNPDVYDVENCTVSSLLIICS